MFGSDAERAVSPVIGVILMVAITVLLAATAATFFVGFEDDLSTGAPTVAVDTEFDVDRSGHELAVKFTSGDVVERRNVKVQVTNADCRGAGTVTDRFDLDQLGVSGSTVAAGTRATISVGTVCPAAASQLDLRRTEVTVTWIGDGAGGGGTVLYRWKGPAA